MTYGSIFVVHTRYISILGGAGKEISTGLLGVFKKYSQMKLQMKREALQKLNRRANEAVDLVQAG